MLAYTGTAKFICLCIHFAQHTFAHHHRIHTHRTTHFDYGTNKQKSSTHPNVRRKKRKHREMKRNEINSVAQTHTFAHQRFFTPTCHSCAFSSLLPRLPLHHTSKAIHTAKLFINKEQIENSRNYLVISQFKSTQSQCFNLYGRTIEVVDFLRSSFRSI